jgi:hypothetical protein
MIRHPLRTCLLTMINTLQGNDTASERSDLTSVTSSVLQGAIGEGRRTYAVYGKEGEWIIYVMIPCLSCFTI